MNRVEAAAPASTGTATEEYEPLDRALQELVKNDQWVDDFIKRLNGAIKDIVREKP